MLVLGPRRPGLGIAASLEPMWSMFQDVPVLSRWSSWVSGFLERGGVGVLAVFGCREASVRFCKMDVAGNWAWGPSGVAWHCPGSWSERK